MEHSGMVMMIIMGCMHMYIYNMCIYIMITDLDVTYSQENMVIHSNEIS